MFAYIQDFFSIYLIIGALTVIAYAWQHFNDPSFPNQETLPHVVEPLRYLFLGPAYQRARFTYVAASLSLYALLVLPGQNIIGALGATEKNFPAQGWPLMVALVLVGLVPNSNNKWISLIEVQMRRGVHSFFLVPDGIVRTIGALEDARYDPPASVVATVQNTPKARLLDDLKLGVGSLEYQWARATMILESLKPRDGVASLLRRASFDPFVEDYEEIRQKYRVIELDVERVHDERGVLSNDRARAGSGQGNKALTRKQVELANREEDLINSVDKLLQRIYAYISWGVRQQAKSDNEVDRIFENLGFHIPDIGRQRLFDVVIPATFLIGAISFIFWMIYDVFDPPTSVCLGVVSSLASATAACLMYGFAIFIALNRRSAQIEEKSWSQSSPRCFVPIATYAGLLSWGIIVASTVLWFPSNTSISLVEIWNWLRSPASGPSAGWEFLPARMATAVPWVVAGAAASILVAHRLGGDVRRTGATNRLRDAIILGGGLGLAAAFANTLQISLSDIGKVAESGAFDIIIKQSGAVSLAGVTCGMVIGYMVPQTCRSLIVSPSNTDRARALRGLLQRAQSMLGGEIAARDWVFSPLIALGGISPAEAVQYKSQVNGVRKLLEEEAPIAELGGPGPRAPVVEAPVEREVTVTESLGARKDRQRV